jgi:hypothetical protein
MPDAGQEELLPQPHARAQQLRRDLGIAALVLLAAAGGVGLIHSTSHSHQASPASSPTSVPLPDLGQPGLPVGGTPPVCPRTTDGQVACTTVHAVPAAFLAAIREALPRVVPRRMVTQRLRPTGPEVVAEFWSRSFVGQAGPTVIRVDVYRGRGPSLPNVLLGRSNHVVVQRGTSDGRYTVQVTVVVEPHISRPTLAALERLAADDRLVRDR